eukprot:1161865-Pelagomonas_calceolata.AAC.22
MGMERGAAEACALQGWTLPQQAPAGASWIRAVVVMVKAGWKKRKDLQAMYMLASTTLATTWMKRMTETTFAGGHNPGYQMDEKDARDCNCWQAQPWLPNGRKGCQRLYLLASTTLATTWMKRMTETIFAGGHNPGYQMDEKDARDCTCWQAQPWLPNG